MNSNLFSKNYLNFIKEKEGFSETPYNCPGGYSTIGYGHRTEFDNTKIEKITK